MVRALKEEQLDQIMKELWGDMTKREVQVDQFRREVLAFAETSAEYLQARLREFPRVLYGAAAVSFLLV